jgi:uncharacterized protein
MTTLLFLVIGLSAGILSGIFGLGGGIVLVPALVYLAKMSQQQAQGTSLAALVLPFGAAVSAYTYYKAGHLQVVPALYVAVGMIAGAFIGAQIATHVDGLVLKRAFAVLLLVVAAKMLLE